jgi:MFS family permease
MTFTVVIGAPMVLTARFVGASESDIGILNALPTGLLLMQIIGAGLVERYGMRPVMVLGWTLRTVAVLPVIATPLLVGRVSPGYLVALGLGLPILVFSLVRGMATTAWLPWLSELLPPTRRGRYFGSEQMVINISAFVTLVACGLFLGSGPEAWRYSVLFACAFVTGISSVLFLRRVPAGQPDPTRRGQPHPRVRDTLRRMRKLLVYEPYRRTWRFIGLQTFAISPMPIFLVLFLRDQAGMAEGVVLKIQAMMTFGVLVSAVLWGRLSDSAGSRPMLRISGVMIIAVGVFWMFAAAGVFRPGLVAVGLALLVYGVFQSMHGVAVTRMMMGCCPRRAVTAGTALLQVTTAMAAALASIGWGFAVRGLGGAQPGGPAPAYAIFFLGCVALALAAQTMLTRVPEPRALRTGQVLQVLYGWPMRALSALATGNGRRKDRD